MTRSLTDLTATIRTNLINKGFRAADGGPGTNTWGDYVALLHSEISEAMEAFRDHGLTDATAKHLHGCTEEDGCEPRCNFRLQPPKPEGVGSELADVAIRLLDMCDAFGYRPFDMDCELADVEPLTPPTPLTTFGTYLAWLHGHVSDMWQCQSWRTFNEYPPRVLRATVTVAEKHGIDLSAEVERKMTYNLTRTWRHGGRNL